MQVLIVLGHWLEPKYRDHWRVFGQLRQVGIKPVQMEQSNCCQVMRSGRFGSSETALLFLVGLKLDHSTFWWPGRQGGLYLRADLLLGARWTSGRLVLAYRPFDRVELFHRIEFDQPFRLDYPYAFYHWHNIVSVEECPVGLEFLWSWTDGVKLFDKEDHWWKWVKVLEEIEECRR